MLETSNSAEKPFQFKRFAIAQNQCAMKVGTDGVLLGAWVDVEGAKTILDVGAGTGLIAIMLGQRNSTAEITAVEIDEEAFEQAKENMMASPWAARLFIVHDSIQHFSQKASSKFDLIVSNPPFFSGGTFSDRQDRTSVRHTVKLPHGDLLLAVRQLLNPKGKFCVILPYLEGLRFIELAKTYRLHCTKMTEVKPREEKSVERLLIEFETEARSADKTGLVIYKNGEEYSDDFIALTREFYLKL